MSGFVAYDAREPLAFMAVGSDTARRICIVDAGREVRLPFGLVTVTHLRGGDPSRPWGDRLPSLSRAVVSVGTSGCQTRHDEVGTLCERAAPERAATALGIETSPTPRWRLASPGRSSNAHPLEASPPDTRRTCTASVQSAPSTVPMTAMQSPAFASPGKWRAARMPSRRARNSMGEAPVRSAG